MLTSQRATRTVANHDTSARPARYAALGALPDQRALAMRASTRLAHSMALRPRARPSSARASAGETSGWAAIEIFAAP